MPVPHAKLLTLLHNLIRFQDRSIHRTESVGSCPFPLRISSRFRGKARDHSCPGETLTPAGEKAPRKHL